MRFNPRARIGSGRVRDVGGRGGGGGGGGGGLGGGTGMRLPGGMVGGGGMGGLIIVILFVVLTQCMGVGLPDGSTGVDSGAQGDGSQAQGSDRYQGCQTGEDANNSTDCARKAVAVSLEDYWSQTLPDQGGVQFQPADIRTFTGQTQTGCGAASSQVGPFYCPQDRRIYLDTTFFDDVLEAQLGGPDGGFVEPYVLAHEYGHHIQNLLGTMGKVKTQQGPRSDAVRLELQADCYAGMWAGAASDTEDESGVAIFEEITDRDIQLAIQAAAAVGDDRIQQKTQGQVTEETWTHGSADSRMRWFRTGYESGRLADCDTWSVETP